jgi:hypothetical protein
MSTEPETDIGIQIEYSERFERQLTEGEPFADTGVRLRAGDSFVTGTDDEFHVWEFVVTLMRKLCDATTGILNGESSSVPFQATSYRWDIEAVDSRTVRVRTSSGGESPPMDRRSFARAVVDAATGLLEYVESTNADLMADQQVRELRTARNEARAAIQQHE